MQGSFQHFHLELDARGVVTILIDVQDRPVNVFDDGVVSELWRIVDQLERDSTTRLVVFRSTKPSGFIAGADIRRIQQIRTEADASSVVGIGQQLFDRIENLTVPTLAVIHGQCLGGGLELALACKFRVARDDAETRLGLPEIQLGLLPAWGGTQRLPRVAGLTAALRMILEGQKLSASRAARIGLVDLAVPADAFEAGVERFIADRLAGKPVHARKRSLKARFLDGTGLGRWVVLRKAREGALKHGVHYPAIPVALKAVATGLSDSHAAGLTVEREGFSQLLFTATSRNLIELFFQRERARKRSTWVADEMSGEQAVRRVAVLGAGTMGAGIAHLAASSGCEVVLKDINDELVAAGIGRIQALMNDAVQKGSLRREEADARLGSITGTTQWGPLKSADLAIEAVVEREQIKRNVFQQLSETLAADAVLASNTSSLPIARLAEAATHPERVAGLHFFNPVHRMQLVEVVQAPGTNETTLAKLVDFVRSTGKVPIVVADSPGFLVNRILSPYLDEAVRLICEGCTASEVDRQAVRFGMPMGPLELLDQVGLDIAAEVSGSLMPRDTSPTPDRLRAMIERGWLGKKSGRGFYSYKDGRRGSPTQWDAGTKTPPPASDTGVRLPAGELTALQRRLVYPIVNEAIHCVEDEIVAEAWIVDLAIVLGTGFAPFRGGPLRMADERGLSRVVQELEALQQAHGARFEPARLLRRMADEDQAFYTSTKRNPTSEPVALDAASH